MNLLQNIHEQLILLRKQRNEWGGICVNFDYSHRHELVTTVAMGWEGYSGDPNYPVEGMEEYHEPNNVLWRNPKRLELLERCIHLTSSIELFPIEEFKRVMTESYHRSDGWIGHEISELLESY